MRSKHSRNFILGTTTFILMIVTPSAGGLLNEPALAIFPPIFGSFLILAFLLNSEYTRISKGFMIVFCGAIFQLGYLNLFIFVMFPPESIPEELMFQLNIFSQILLIVCSGAGGSIIAAHADKTTTDNEKTILNSTNIDTKQSMTALTKAIANLDKKLNILIAALAILALAALILLGALLIK